MTKEQVERAKQISVLDYVCQYEAEQLTTTYHANGKLMHCKTGEYRTVEHDSLSISPKGFYWWSRRQGGKTALDYLMMVKGMKFKDAVEHLTAGTSASVAITQTHINTPVEPEKRELILPEAAEQQRRVIAYLTKSRCVDFEIVEHCLKTRMLYESRDHHNAVFVGFKEDGTTGFCSIRSTLTESKWRMNQAGSKKKYSFRILNPSPSSELIITESPIDAMSFATLLKQRGVNWRDKSYLSLDGVSSKALMHCLSVTPYQRVMIALDNDEAGQTAAQKIKVELSVLHPDVKVRICRPAAEQGKDWNEVLCNKHRARETETPSQKSKPLSLSERINAGRSTAKERNSAVQIAPKEINTL